MRSHCAWARVFYSRVDKQVVFAMMSSVAECRGIWVEVIKAGESEGKESRGMSCRGVCHAAEALCEQ